MDESESNWGVFCARPMSLAIGASLYCFQYSCNIRTPKRVNKPQHPQTAQCLPNLPLYTLSSRSAPFCRIPGHNALLRSLNISAVANSFHFPTTLLCSRAYAATLLLLISASWWALCASLLPAVNAPHPCSVTSSTCAAPPSFHAQRAP